MTLFADKTLKPGDFVRKLRKLNGMTQKDLADKIEYSLTQIKRIETGTKDISKEAMNLLSEAFNVDLHHYIFISNTFKIPNQYDEYINLRKLVETREYNKIRNTCARLRTDLGNLQGEMLQLVLYGEAILSTHVDNNYEKSVKLCNEALEVFELIHYIDSLSETIFTEMSYPILFLLTYNYSMLGDDDLVRNLSNALYYHFRDIIFTSSIPVKSDMYHMKKYYIVVTNNLSHQHFFDKDYLKALELIDHAIFLSNKFDIHIHMYYLLELKFKTHYMLDDILNAKKYYYFFLTTCEISGNSQYYKGIIAELKSEYHLLFD